MKEKENIASLIKRLDETINKFIANNKKIRENISKLKETYK